MRGLLYPAAAVQIRYTVEPCNEWTGAKKQFIKYWTGKTEICFQNGHTFAIWTHVSVRLIVVASALYAAVAYRQPRRHSLVLDPILKYCKALWAIPTYHHFTLLFTTSYSFQPFLGESTCVRLYPA